MKKRIIQETIFVTLANLIVAILINLLAWQFKLVSGGLTGYALVLNFLTEFPAGMILLAMNMILLVIAFLVVGKGVGVKAIYGFVSLSVFIDVTRYLMRLQQNPIDDFLTSLILIIMLSISMGTAVSVILANSYSVGGYSTIFVIVEKFLKIPAQTLFFILDFILAIISGLIFGWDRGFLLFVNAVVAYFVVKILLLRFKFFFEKLKLFKN